MAKLLVCSGCGVHVAPAAPCPFCRTQRSGRTTRAGLVMAGLLALGGAGCGANPPPSDAPEPPVEAAPDAAPPVEREGPPPEPVRQPLYGAAPVVQPLYGVPPQPQVPAPLTEEQKAAQEKAEQEKAEQEKAARKKPARKYEPPPDQPLYGIAPFE